MKIGRGDHFRINWASVIKQWWCWRADHCNGFASKSLWITKVPRRDAWNAKRRHYSIGF